MFFDHLLKQNDVIVDTKSDLVNLWIPYFHSKNSIYQVKNWNIAATILISAESKKKIVSTDTIWEIPVSLFLRKK